MSEYPGIEKVANNGVTEAGKELAAAEAALPPHPGRGCTGEERRTYRAALLRVRAARHKVKSAAAFKASHDATCHIPFGQPILVGHHSEKGHRRALSRSHAAMDRFVDEGQTAKNLESKARGVEFSTDIRTEDSDAIEQLQNKISELEAEREKMKATNKAWRAYDKKKDDKPLRTLGFSDDEIKKMADAIEQAYSWCKQPYPSYTLSNLGQNLTRYKKRLALLQQREKAIEAQDDSEKNKVVHGVEWIEDAADNRLRLVFPGKPSAEVRSELKSQGFRWSPRYTAWQRSFTYPDTARRKADYVIGAYVEDLRKSQQ